MNHSYIEILLLGLLFLTIHSKCEKLSNLSNTVLGKAFFLSIVFLLIEYFGIQSGFIASLILILLLFKSSFREYFSEFSSNPPLENIIPKVTTDDRFKLERQMREQSERKTLSASCAHGGERFGKVHLPF